MEKATLGGGCFWCVEAVYRRVLGVSAVVSGYTGGHTANPTYEQVCAGTTGHAEAIQIDFDPSVIDYSGVLDLFWKAHDPTTLNRQGADAGTQYRSIILTHNERQRDLAVESKAAAAASFSEPIVTEITALGDFHPAEPYHQDYYNQNKRAGYCRIVIAPKIAKLGMSV